MDKLVKDDTEKNGIGEETDHQREHGEVEEQAHPAMYPPM